MSTHNIGFCEDLIKTIYHQIRTLSLLLPTHNFSCCFIGLYLYVLTRGPFPCFSHSSLSTRSRSFIVAIIFCCFQPAIRQTNLSENLREDWTCPTEPPLKIKSLLLLNPEEEIRSKERVDI